MPLIGYYTSHSIETVGKLVSAACDAGAQIFNNIAVQDVMIKVDILLKQLYDFRIIIYSISFFIPLKTLDNGEHHTHVS